ncbi:MAG: hypothetical protein J6I54_00605 [Bacteroidaceae bacterium]|nr:hypothetical protein [Bacteroidaceae bacterium]
MIEFITGAALGATVVVAKDILSDKSKGNDIGISQISEQEEQIEKLLKRNRELERQVEDLLASNKKMYSELSHSKDGMDNLQDKIEDLQSELRKQKTINEQTLQENKELKDSIHSYINQLSEQKNDD